MIQRLPGLRKGQDMERGGASRLLALMGGARVGFPVRRSSEQTRSWSAPVGTILVAGVRPQAWVKRVFLYLKAAVVVQWL